MTAGSGVTGTLGTITRSDGSTQATYDGHPLYTYVGDKSPGQNKGNGLNISGGLWWEMTVSGSTPAAAARRRRLLSSRSPSGRAVSKAARGLANVRGRARCGHNLSHQTSSPPPLGPTPRPAGGDAECRLWP